MVKHLTHNLKIESSNPATGIGRKKMFLLELTCKSVKHLTHNPKIECSNPAASMGRDNCLD
jgi:hypothetical protein